MSEVLNFLTFRMDRGRGTRKYTEIGDVVSNPGPTKKGYLSPKYVLYPLEIVLQLEQRCSLSKMQIMVHKEFVPSAMTVAFGDFPQGRGISLKNATFGESFGKVTFDNPDEAEKPHAREMKVIEFSGTQPVLAAFIKLKFTANYPTKNNKFNQVGIVAICLIGRPYDFEDVESNGNAVYDLTMSAYIDEEIMDHILRLEVQKQQALQLEKAKETEKLKNAIGHLVQVGYEHGRLIAEANIIAKETHDEDKVQELIQEAEHLKLNAYIEVQLYDLVSLSFLK